MVMNSTELETSSNRGGFLVNEEKRTIRSILELIANGSKASSNATDLHQLVNRESDEYASNVISSKSIPIILVILLTDYRNESVDVPNNNNFFSNFYADLEPMFSPSAPLLDQNEESTGKLN